MQSESLPPPRDPDAAVREEYDLALARGTADALELFLVRYPGHGLAADARERLDRLRAKPNIE
jgi:hypothetical protein